MNKLNALIKRNLKEIIRDPLSLVFCLGFPVVMLVLLQLIFSQVSYIPENFKIENYAVGICVFGYTFSMLFVAMLVAGDKNSEFINRLNMAPISKFTYLLSYFVSMLPIVLFQTIIFFAIALIFGLGFSINLILATIYLLPSAIFYISLGILIGSLCKSEKQTGPISSIIISLTSLLGGVFMPVDDMGIFSTIVNLFPFTHSVKIASGVFQNNLTCIYPHIIWVLGYTILIWIITLLLYKRKK